MQKKIALLSYHTCPLAAEEGKETGGMNIYVLQTAKELARTGFVIDIFTRSQDAGQPHIVEVAENLRVIHIKAGPEDYFLPDSEENKTKFFTYLPEFVENIKKFQKENNLSYDILDCHYYLSGLAGMALKENQPNLPLIISFHTLAFMKNLISNNGLTEQEKKRIAGEVTLVENATTIVTPSENEKKYLEYFYNAPASKIKIISPGVDTALFYPTDQNQAKKAVGADKDHKMVLFVGRIEPVKGIDVLIYSMKVLLKQHPALKACLWIVGGDTSQDEKLWSRELQKLEQLRELLHLTTTVKFLGQKHQHELPVFYNAADLVVMPSHYESFGMTALEAMACGTPVLTTNVTGISELLDESCQKHITIANNPLVLAEKMADILQHHHESEDREMLASVKEYDWKKVAVRINRLYEAI